MNRWTHDRDTVRQKETRANGQTDTEGGKNRDGRAQRRTREHTLMDTAVN